MVKTALLFASLLLLASCEVAAFLPAAKPVVDRSLNVATNPAIADANHDGRASFMEILGYILGIAAVPTGVAVAAFAKASNAQTEGKATQKEVDEQWDASAKAGQLTDHEVTESVKTAAVAAAKKN